MTKVSTPALLKGAAVITKAIVSIQGRGKKLDADIQHAALSIIDHIAGPGSGDVSLAEQLVHALPKGSRKTALVAWFHNFGPMRELNPTLHVADKAKLEKNKDALFQYVKGKMNMEKGIETPWYDCKPEGPLLAYFDVDAAIAGLIKKLEAELEGSKELRGMSKANDRMESLQAAIAKAAAKEKAKADAATTEA